MNNSTKRIYQLNYNNGLVSQKIAQINNILSILKQCKISNPNHISSDSDKILMQIILQQI